jgi:DNA (cytosine-5)-methyltransferase 1
MELIFDTEVRTSPQKQYISIPQKPTKTFSVLSLFSGCGGLDLGFMGDFKFRNQYFSRNKFDVVFSNDIEPATTLVYNQNRKYFKHSLTQCDVKEITDLMIPDFDIMLAGFPCQPFSNAGQRKGIDDTRGTLFEECVRLITIGKERKKQPIAFVFENVRGMLSSKMPDGTTVPDEIVNRMSELGYKTTYQLVKASNFGVPSDRYRVIMVGVREDLPMFDFDLMTQVVQEFNLPNAINAPYELRLGAILSDIPSDSPRFEDYWKYSPSGQYMIDKIGTCLNGEEALEDFKNKIPLENISETISKGRSWKNMDPEDMSPRFRRIWDDPKKYHAPNFYRRFALGEINGTITASAQPENCGITHPFLDRRFTIREIARIQSFPDDFEFPSTTLANAYKVIGNAVPPILGWVIAKALEKHLAKNLL